MEKIDKFIARLSRNVAHDVLDALHHIRLNDLQNINIKKLQGRKDEYRARVGRIRIKFVKTNFGNIITDIGFRDDNTY